MRTFFCHVPVDAVDRKDALRRIACFLDESRPHLVTTPNPEMVVAASRDKEFCRALQLADLAIPDGTGLVLMSRLIGQPLPERVTGADLVRDIAALAARRRVRLFLLGGGEGVAGMAATKLLQENPRLKIVGAMSGGRVSRGDGGRWETSRDAIAEIRRTRPEILFVAFGHGKQEEWIVQHLRDMPFVRVAMGIGGSFDFIAGRANRAPKILRNAGLEWLWRLFTQPWRLRRIADAVFVFPWLVFRCLR